MFTAWPIYAMPAAGLLGMFLTQSAVIVAGVVTLARSRLLSEDGAAGASAAGDRAAAPPLGRSR